MKPQMAWIEIGSHHVALKLPPPSPPHRDFEGSSGAIDLRNGWPDLTSEMPSCVKLIAPLPRASIPLHRLMHSFVQWYVVQRSAVATRCQDFLSSAEESDVMCPPFKPYENEATRCTPLRLASAPWDDHPPGKVIKLLPGAVY